MVQKQVRVQHGAKHIATVRVVVPQGDDRRAVLLAEQTVRSFHHVPPQVALIGTIVR